MNGFEIVEAIPSRMTKSKYAVQHAELIQFMLTVPSGKSVRKGFPNPLMARSYYQSISGYIKKAKLKESYFVSFPKTPPQDGKFYVYIGRRGE